jgi:hypothetical protein
MRRHLGIILTVILVIAVILALSAAGSIEFDRPYENELTPNRSSYNSGPTGTRALYQLLEESGVPVSRWRKDFSSLKDEAEGATLIVVGPFQAGQKISEKEAEALQGWVSRGGRALIVSRAPEAQFGDPVIHTKAPDKPPDGNVTPEQAVDRKSDELIEQPTELTWNLRGLAFSQFASRMKFYPPETSSAETDSADANSTDADSSETNSTKSDSEADAASSPTPERSVEGGSNPSTEGAQDQHGEYPMRMLYAPVVHLGDKDGAALADFAYDKGRVIFLSDPFVAANNGIAMGANLTLITNILHSMGAPNQKVFFDEYHHGYRSENNPLVNYFRGTPVPWLLLQGLLLSLLILYTYGRRFARALPLPQLDRHSPLEFVSSMANLQQATESRELALENIYPRFKARLCRRLGLSSRAQKDEILTGARRLRLPVSEIELRQTLSDAEMALAGEKMDDAQLVTVVSRMRHILSQIGK